MRLPEPTTEQKVLFRILRGDPPTDMEGVDTDRLFDLFRRHRLFNLAGELLPLMPDIERERWKQVMSEAAMKSLYFTSMLKDLVSHLENNGIEVMAFKGPVLSQQLYNHAGTRQYRDLDIFVAKSEIDKVISLSSNLGFELVFPRPGLSHGQWDYYIRHKKHFGMRHKEMGALVEIHTGLENHVVLDPEYEARLIMDPERVRIGGSGYLSMNLTMTFLYLVLHGGAHLFRRLFWLKDVADALERWDLDHERIMSDAISMKIEPLLLLSLILARKYFQVDIPDPYSKYIKNGRRKLNKLRHSTDRTILGPEYPTRAGKIRRHLFLLRLKPGVLYKYHVIREIFIRFYIGKYLE